MARGLSSIHPTFIPRAACRPFSTNSSVETGIGGIGAAESLSGFEEAAHVVIARMVTAIARTIPKINLNSSVNDVMARAGVLRLLREDLLQNLAGLELIL